ncbi:MAG: hypothetical protein DWQ06_00460 [Calditrichaeota bacterium]|nr:MAG: hypothetical protein DWQ06_00460 [Calditrichota bacterium]
MGLFAILIFKICFVVKKGNFEIDSIVGDALTYHNFAINLLENPITYWDFWGHYRPPGYPFFLMIIYFFFGKDSIFSVYIFQSFLGLGISILVYEISNKVFSKKIALFSFIFAGVYPFYLIYSVQLLRETLVFFLLLITFYFLLLLFGEMKKVKSIFKAKYFWIFTVSYSLLIHTDPRYLFFAPFLLGLYYFYLEKRDFIKNSFLTIALFIFTLIPWTIRNFYTYGGIVIINTRTIDFTGTEKEVNRLKLSNDKINGTLINKKYPTQEERLLIKRGENPNNREEEEIKAILEGKGATKSHFLKRIYNFVELWRPVRLSSSYRPFNDCRFEKAWSIQHNLLSLFSYGLLLPFMFFGILKLYLDKNRWLLFLVFPIILQTLLHILMWGKERYRIPIDSFIILFGVYGIIMAFDSFKTKVFQER